MIETFFPSPIGYYDLTEPEKNSIFEEYMLNENQITNSMTGETWDDNVYTTAKNYTNILFSFNLKNTYNILNNYIFDFLFESVDKFNIKKIDSFYIGASWYNLLPPLGFQGLHQHVIYGNNRKQPFCSGALFFDLDFLDQVDTKSLVFNLENNYTFPNQSKIVTYNYIPGRIILFPSTLPHQVLFNKSNKNRKSMSFNVFGVYI